MHGAGLLLDAGGDPRELHAVRGKEVQAVRVIGARTASINNGAILGHLVQTFDVASREMFDSRSGKPRELCLVGVDHDLGNGKHVKGESDLHETLLGGRDVKNRLPRFDIGVKGLTIKRYCTILGSVLNEYLWLHNLPRKCAKKSEDRQNSSAEKG